MDSSGDIGGGDDMMKACGRPLPILNHWVPVLYSSKSYWTVIFIFYPCFCLHVPIVIPKHMFIPEHNTTLPIKATGSRSNYNNMIYILRGGSFIETSLYVWCMQNIRYNFYDLLTLCN